MGGIWISRSRLCSKRGVLQTSLQKFTKIFFHQNHTCLSRVAMHECTFSDLSSKKSLLKNLTRLIKKQYIGGEEGRGGLNVILTQQTLGREDWPPARSDRCKDDPLTNRKSTQDYRTNLNHPYLVKRI